MCVCMYVCMSAIGAHTLGATGPQFCTGASLLRGMVLGYRVSPDFAPRGTLIYWWLPPVTTVSTPGWWNTEKCLKQKLFPIMGLHKYFFFVSHFAPPLPQGATLLKTGLPLKPNMLSEAKVSEAKVVPHGGFT